MTQQSPRLALRRKGFIWLTGYSLSSSEEKIQTRDRNLRIRTEAETTEEHSSAGHLSLLVLLPLLYGSVPPDQGGTTHSGMDPPYQLAIKKMTPRHIHRLM